MRVGPERPNDDRRARCRLPKIAAAGYFNTASKTRLVGFGTSSVETIIALQRSDMLAFFNAGTGHPAQTKPKANVPISAPATDGASGIRKPKGVFSAVAQWSLTAM